MKTEQRWVQAERLTAIRNNLAFWAVQTAATRHTEAGNLHSAVQHGLQQVATRASAARLLTASFAVAQAQPADWLALYSLAQQNTQLPSRVRAELHYQHAVLHWLVGESALAAKGFQRTLRMARQFALPTMQAQALIGACMVHTQDPPRAHKAAQQLTQLLTSVSLPNRLRAQAQAALAAAAYFARQHPLASQHAAAALKGTPASIARGQLHILAGLSALAQEQVDAALEHYNAAAKLLQQHGASASQLAHLELLRATAHYHKTTRGQRVRVQPAIAALLRAAALLARSDTDATSRTHLESLLGRAFTLSGDVASGLRYLASALQLSEDAGEHSMAADIFAALQQLENKNPA